MKWLLKARRVQTNSELFELQWLAWVGRKVREWREGGCPYTESLDVHLQTQNAQNHPCFDFPLGSQRQQQQPQPDNKRAIQGSCLAGPEMAVII